MTGALRQRLPLPALATTLVLAPALRLGAIWALLLSDLFARWPRRTRGGDCWSW